MLIKEVKVNKEGFKTNFSNQIDILRFLKSFSSHYPKEFYTDIENRDDYGNIIMDTFHPVCTPVAAYCLSLLEDYIWRAEESKTVFTVLKEYAAKESYSSFLSPFVETLETSSNVLTVFYILKFVNELMGATVS